MRASHHGGHARLLILGGGYVGIDAYRAVMRQMGAQVRRGQVEITVVNSTLYHTFHGFTGEVLGGVLPLERTLTPLRDLLPHARVIEATVTRAELPLRRVHISDAGGRTATLPYDHLLIGTGSCDPFGRVPGLREHGWRLKDSRDMQAFRAHLEGRITGRQPTTLAVIGGGFAGVEMAAALRERLTRCGLDGEVHLLCSGGVLDCLQGRYQRLAAYARHALERAGVQLHLGRRVTEIRAGEVRLEDGSALRADEILYAAGIALSVLPGTEGLPRDSAGRLLTDEFLHVRGQPRLWTGGDAARVKRPAAAGDCPVNALWAMKHGMWAGHNMARSLQARPLKRFSYRGLGQAAGLGRGDGVGELLGVPVTGAAAWWLRLLFFVWHMPSKGQGARTLLAMLRPRPARVTPGPALLPAGH